MYEQGEKPKEAESRAVSNSVGQKMSDVKQAFRFVENRPESAVQHQPSSINSLGNQNVMQRLVSTY